MDFSKQLQKAEEALRRRNYDFAVELYRHLLDLDPDLGEARSGLRQALAKRFEAKKPSRLLRAIGGAAPLGKAKSLRKLGKLDACAKALEGYLGSNPLDVDANLELGVVLEEAGHLKSAKAVYEFVADIAPKNPEGLKRAGAMFYAAGDHARALAYYEGALQADPRDQDALKARKNLAAEAALSSADLDSAQHSRQRLVDSDQTQELERRQRRHLSEEELRAEVEKLEGRLAENPSDPDLLLEIAELHERLKDPEAALEFAERALDYRRDDFELAAKVGDLRAKVLRKQVAVADKAGDREQADRLERQLAEQELEDWKQRVELRPGDAALRVQLARRLLRAGEADAAIAELQKAQGDPRVRREVPFLKGRAFQDKGYLDLATKEYEAALEGLPPTEERAKEIRYNLSLVSEEAGDLEAARDHLARVFEVDIGFRDVSERMERLRGGS